jgi:glutaredoxin
MYYLFVVLLEGCPYCAALKDLLKNYKIKYKSIEIKQQEKHKYVTSEINTFPQVYLKKSKTEDSLLLGGYSDFESFCNTFINKKYNETNIQQFNKKYQLWNKRSILRLMEIINSLQK